MTRDRVASEATAIAPKVAMSAEIANGTATSRRTLGLIRDFLRKGETFPPR